MTGTNNPTNLAGDLVTVPREPTRKIISIKRIGPAELAELTKAIEIKWQVAEVRLIRLM